MAYEQEFARVKQLSREAERLRSHLELTFRHNENYSSELTELRSMWEAKLRTALEEHEELHETVEYEPSDNGDLPSDI